MSALDNFRQAVHELFGIGQSAKKEKLDDLLEAIERTGDSSAETSPVSSAARRALDTTDIQARDLLGETDAAPEPETFAAPERETYTAPEAAIEDEPEPVVYSRAEETPRTAAWEDTGSKSYAREAASAAAAAAEAETANEEEAPAYGEPVFAPAQARAAEPARDYESGDFSVLGPQKDTSVIARGATVIGRIRTDGHMEIMGRVDGSIDADGDVAIQGQVIGKVKGNYLGLDSCRVKGNLSGASGVVVNTDSIVVGDVMTESILLDGKLKGNINANHTVAFKNNAYVIGDVQAGQLSVEAGAVLNGMVTTVGHDDDRLFENLFL
jgi:cytoskeletal protein CcmA (bactofilin family)